MNRRRKLPDGRYSEFHVLNNHQPNSEEGHGIQTFKRRQMNTSHAVVSEYWFRCRIYMYKPIRFSC